MPYKLSCDECAALADKAAGLLAKYCVNHDIYYVITGSSGGLDSAVTLALAQRACQIARQKYDFHLDSVGIIMPCQSHPDAERLGREAIKCFGAHEIRIDLTEVFHDNLHTVETTDRQIKGILETTYGDKALTSWDWSQRIAQGNLKARLRMMYGTYHVARMMHGMVLSTDNLSEYWMAFWTINGDVGDYGMIQQVLKGLELYDLARYLGVPQEIIDAMPDDGLNIGNGDADQLGADYETIDRVMTTLIQQGFDPDGPRNQLNTTLPYVLDVKDTVLRGLATRALNGAFKRHGPIALTRSQLGLPEIEDIEL